MQCGKYSSTRVGYKKIISFSKNHTEGDGISAAGQLSNKRGAPRGKERHISHSDATFYNKTSKPVQFVSIPIAHSMIYRADTSTGSAVP